jgi:hypothetical protein
MADTTSAWQMLRFEAARCQAKLDCAAITTATSGAAWHPGEFFRLPIKDGETRSTRARMGRPEKGGIGAP